MRKALLSILILILPTVGRARPIALHLAVIDGVITSEARVTEIATELAQISAIAPVRTLVAHVRVGAAHQTAVEAARFRENLVALLHDAPEIETLVLQGPLVVDHLGHATLPPFGSFDFLKDDDGGATYLGPLRGRLSPAAAVTVLDGHALAGEWSAARERARRTMDFLGAFRGSFFGLTGGPDFSGRRVLLGGDQGEDERLYPGLDGWKILGCDLRLGNIY